MLTFGRRYSSDWARTCILLLISWAFSVNAIADSISKRVINGFDLSDTLVPSDEIYHGGPPKDGIPPIDQPKFISSELAHSLSDDSRILGLTLNGVSKAYPIGILNYHEIVNDEFDGQAVTISFCPLCGTGMVFDATFKDAKTTFGVSGLLYNSDLLMYDRLTDSLWSQIEGKAISGQAKGYELRQLPVEHTSWLDWKSRFPDTLVLSQDTGHQRNYDRSPYPYYEKSDRVYFPVSSMDKRYHPKEVVVGLSMDNASKVYPFSELAKGNGELKDQFQGQEITIQYSAAHRSAVVRNSKGGLMPSLTAFWFAWMAFHPNSQVYTFSN